MMRPAPQQDKTKMYALLGLGALVLLYLLVSRPSDTTVYSIMMDAGSTGSRIHVYKFIRETDAGGSPLTLQSEVFEQLKPGLSAYATNPSRGAESLLPLLKAGADAIPDDLEPSTVIALKATAGLRLLGPSEAERILQETRSLLGQQTFNSDPQDIDILDGLDEGLFAWVTVNYLLGKVVGPSHQTAAVMDLGGGSTQIAMAAPANGGGSGLRRTPVMGAEHNMFLHSYLGLGLMAGRAAILRTASSSVQAEESPCVSKGSEVVYNYGKENFKSSGSHFSSAAACIAHVTTILRMEGGAMASAPRHPKFEPGQPVFAMSYYFDRAVYTNLLDKDAIRGKVVVRDFGLAASDACTLDAAGVKAKFPNVPDSDVPFLCMDLSFIVGLLEHGFGLDSAAEVTLAKKLPYNGEEVETAWPLGASLADLSRVEL